MSGTNPRMDMPLNGSDSDTSELPTGTVTLLLADIEGSTGLWQNQPEEMTAAIARLDRALRDVISAHQGVRPVDQGEGDSFVVAFMRASDAVACALDLQRAPLAPIRLRIGVHTGEVQLRDEGNYVGMTINRTARLRDLAHGGQTVLSGLTEDLVLDRLPADAWLIDLGSHRLRDIMRLERVVQLCHADLGNDFPPLRSPYQAVAQRLPAQLTRFIGRATEIADIQGNLVGRRLVTLTGAGGVGKTRLAIEVAARVEADFDGGVWWVDLGPITDPDLVPMAVIRTFGLPDQQGSSTMDILLRFVGDRRMLLVLDNCEHLLEACAQLVIALQARCPSLTLMATSREPLGLAGEVSWRVPSLSIAHEAIELFTERARHARPDFRLTDAAGVIVTEICRRLDGVPLAIELAAARVRVLSLTEIRDSLHDRFRLLTGGARSTVRRQQTLQASVDWSHALLTDLERTVFARLAVFMGGFDLHAAEAVAGHGEVQRFQVLDLLTLLVDKSLVVAESVGESTRYRLLETMREYASEKLGECGQAETSRQRHRDHYSELAAMLDTTATWGHQQRVEQAEAEIDNLRAAFTWSIENDDRERAAELASSLQPLWLMRGHIREGLAWFDAALTAHDRKSAEFSPALRARALADKATLDAYMGATDSMEGALQGLAIAREVGDPGLVLRALTACGGIAVYDPEVARPFFAEAVGLARSLGDGWRLGQILGWLAYGGVMGGAPMAIRAAAEEGLALADATGDRFTSHACRWSLGVAQGMSGDAVGAAAALADVVADAAAAGDAYWGCCAEAMQALMLTYHGDLDAARTAAGAAVDAAAQINGLLSGLAQVALAAATLAAGDIAAADEAITSALGHLTIQPKQAAIWIAYAAQVALIRGDLDSARRLSDEAVAATHGFHRSLALTTRAAVAIVQGDGEQADRDAHDALATAADARTYGATPDSLECLAILALNAGRHREAARFFGAADGVRRRCGLARFHVFDPFFEFPLAAVREAMGETEYEAAWTEGGALSTEEAVAYAQRRRGARKRPSNGWAALTPTELDVARLVGGGLATNDIAARLFVSPRTVQTHLTHIYAKLGVSSRVQLAQEVARRH